MEKKTSIFRKEHFNAAHRLFVPEWTDAQNGEYFGKCANPHYHGHNYEVVVKVTGVPDPVTVNEIKSSDSPCFQRNEVPVVESMEGAALHYVCLMEKIPFLQLRAISNVLGDRDKTRWNIQAARENLHASLVALLQKFEKADETLFRI